MDTQLTLTLLGFGLILLSAGEVGKFVSKRFGIPLISGFVLTGVLVGPYIIGFFGENVGNQLWFVDWIALPFIALAAGAELHFGAFRSNFRRIIVVIVCIIIAVLCFGTTAIVLLRDSIPFLSGMDFYQTLIVALLGASILIAISPSSTIAVIKELRARGDFTQTALGITIFMDAIVIVVFAFNHAIADVILRNESLRFSTIAIVLLEVTLDIGFGILVAQFFRVIFQLPIRAGGHWLLCLGIGFGIFQISHSLHDFHPFGFPVQLFSEPLLVAMVAGLVASNFLPCRIDFERFIEEVAPAVFIVFFTAVGATLEIDVLTKSWWIIVILMTVRLAGMYSGSALGSMLTGGSKKQARYMGLAFITQAGISLSLAKEVSVTYPTWGVHFTTLFIGIIVLNTLIGPPFFKIVLTRMKESHKRGFREGQPQSRVIIFGIDNQTLALARQLQDQGRDVIVANTASAQTTIPKEQYPDLEIQVVSDISKESLIELGADRASTIVSMLEESTNYKICETAYESFGTENLVTLLPAKADAERFYELGVLIVDPATAMVNLLDLFVRSPSTATLLLGQESGKDVLEVEVLNKNLHGKTLRTLHLPQECLIISLRRKGSLVLSHGYTCLRLGDEVTIIGNRDTLREVEMLFYGAGIEAKNKA